MKFWKVFRFEVAYQGRRASTWLYFVLLLSISYLLAREVFLVEAQAGNYFLNAPFAVAQVTLVAYLLALLALGAVAGGAAARDVETGMHPLLYTAPVGKAAYLGGRFLAAFTLGALILLAIPLGLLGASLLPGTHADLLGPLRPLAYLSAYLLLAVPNAVVTMALMLSAATVGRRPIASYLGGVVVFAAAVLSWQLLAEQRGHWDVAKLTDPLGLSVIGELGRIWTPGQKNALVVGPQASLLWNRLLWLGVASLVLALTCLRFRFAHVAAGGGRGRTRGEPVPAAPSAPIAVPRVRRTFGPGTRVHQTLAVAGQSFRMIVLGWGGLTLAGLFAIVVLTGPLWFDFNGVPVLPTAGRLVNQLESTGEGFWLLVPLLLVYYAGELVWRERESGLHEITGAAPVSAGVCFAGKLAGLALVLVVLQALMMAAAMIVQVRLGYHTFEWGLLARVLFGMRLADYLLFALLALVVQVVVDQKHVAHAIAVGAYVLMAFGSQLGIESTVLLYGSDPGWTYSDLRGLDPFLRPWLLFKLYWAAWALLLAVGAKLLWPRGTERGLRPRLRLARHRLTRWTVGTAALAAALVLTLGGLIVSNTQAHARQAALDWPEMAAEYERRYGRYADAPQPRPTAVQLQVEIHPREGTAEIRGTYDLVNRTEAAIGAIHLATDPGVETREVGFDRPARLERVDDEVGHRTYALKTPLRPGETLRLAFEVRFSPHGFPSRGIDPSIAANGSSFGMAWLPAVGYRRSRELRTAAERREHGLAARPEVPRLDDAAVVSDAVADAPDAVLFDAIVGTDAGQIAVAPGTLRESWVKDGRRYFHYSTEAPILNAYAFQSAAYAVEKAQWNGVAIEVLHHPGHAGNVQRLLRGAEAAVATLSRRLGPYPHRQVRLVEIPGAGFTAHAAPINITYQEGLALLDPDHDPRGIDVPFAVAAHEVAHHWWGGRVVPAGVEGAPLLTESLAWYSAFEVVEAAHGRDHLARLLGAMREEYLSPRARAGPPLLRGFDWFLAYRKGPLAMYALREYVGTEPVNAALRRLFERHASATAPLPTSLDLYRELQAATPATLRPLLADLFERNTYWELAAEQAEAAQVGPGAWRVTLDLRARKVVVDEVGEETEVPMDDLVEVGVFGERAAGGSGELYLRRHGIRSGPQRITLTVQGKPTGAGIDPRNLLIDVEPRDNVAEIGARLGIDKK